MSCFLDNFDYILFVFRDTFIFLPSYEMTNLIQQTPAQAIKSELKQRFPSTVFSCRYKTYSWGCSVDISWKDGPCEKDVYPIVNKYKYGHFDWMTDMYNMDNCRDDIPQAWYVFCKREMYPEVEAVVNSWALDKFSDSDKYRYYNWQSMARNLFSFYPITSWNISIIDTGVTCWSWIEEKYAIINQ